MSELNRDKDKGKGMEVTKLKQQIKEVKKELYDTKMEGKLDKDRIKQLENEIENIKLESHNKDILIHTHEKSIEDLKRNVNFRRSQIDYLQHESKKRQSIINGLKKEKWSKCQDTIDELKLEVIKYKREKEKLLIENRDLVNKAQNLSIVEALNLLNSMLNRGTVKYYGYVFDKLVRRVNKLRGKELTKVNSLHNTEFEDEELLGYIGLVEDDVVFFSTYGDMYPVDEVVSAVKLLDKRLGYPCRAILKSDLRTVAIQETYVCEDLMKSMNKNNIKINKVEKLKSSYNFKYSNALEIAIIGSHVKQDYLIALQKVGLKGVWFNSHDLRRDRIVSKIGGFDITVVLTDETVNSVTKVLNNEEYNILYMSKDTVNHLLSYLNVEIHRLGLAEIVNMQTTDKECNLDILED